MGGIDLGIECTLVVVAAVIYVSYMYFKPKPTEVQISVPPFSDLLNSQLFCKRQ